ncbi:MAG: TatD family hydrolase, partial [Candidatus Micrarchaeaceae archaeon]
MLQKSVSLQNLPIRTDQKDAVADAHTHLDLLTDPSLIKKSIELGVTTIITCGTNIETSLKALSIADGAFIFPEVGLDPQNAIFSHSEIDKMCGIAEKNKDIIVGIGEIGLDYKYAISKEDRKLQLDTFMQMVDLAIRLRKPITVHSRDSMADVLDALRSSGAKKVQLHYFEGNERDARNAAD